MQTAVVLIGLGFAMFMGWVCQTIAQRKGYDDQTWGAAGFLAWPIALPLVLLKPRNPKMFRRCPDCGADDVPYNVPVCRHCGRDERKQQAS